jgi:manganese oxidase
MASEDRSVLGWTSFLVAIGALVIALLIPVIGDDDGVSSAAGAALTVLDVELGALVIDPDQLTATPGHIQLRVTNVDPQPHNLSIAGQKTKDLQQGESEVLDLGVLGAGSYEMLCEIAGHAAGGMTGALTIGGTSASPSESAAGTDHATHETADYLHGYASWEEMEAAMNERAMAFLDPAIKGEVGGQVLAPEILPDGTKRFEVTAAITDWEIEPGVIVKAWTYNGVVPAPEISIDVGDKVQVVLTNNLPTATSIHFHGVRVPNAMDGVPPYTQDSVAPGATYTYEFEAIEPAVGIYHSHSGAEQVLDGLFGAFMIGEMTLPDELASQGIDHVDQEVNMVLNDAGVIGLSLNGKSFPATQAYSARVGDVLMVHYFNEGLLAHPMHLHQPVGWVIAKDGKELLVPMPGDTINIAPGERYTVVYKIQDPGVWAWHCHILTHAERADGMFGMVTALVVEP